MPRKEKSACGLAGTRLQLLPVVSTEELRMRKTQDSGPRIAEMHIKEMISVTPVSYIYSYTEKVLNSLT